MKLHYYTLTEKKHLPTIITAMKCGRKKGLKIHIIYINLKEKKNFALKTLNNYIN